MKPLIIASLLALFNLHKSKATCGKEGAAWFHNDAALPQGASGELRMALLCAVDQEFCSSESLPVVAQGNTDYDSSKVFAYYGSNISEWCTGKVTDFSGVFYMVDVSVAPMMVP